MAPETTPEGTAALAGANGAAGEEFLEVSL